MSISQHIEHLTAGERAAQRLSSPQRAAWQAWHRACAAVPDGRYVTDVIARDACPDPAVWDRLRDFDIWAMEQAGISPSDSADKPAPAPPRVPPGMWQPLAALDQTAAVDVAGAWVAKWHGDRPWRGLLLSGPTGTGKTVITCAMAHDIGDVGAWWHATDVCQHIRDRDVNRAGGYARKSLASRSLLILDDLGAERDADYERSIMVELLEARHRRRVLTIVATNLRPDELTARYGSRVTSRFSESMHPVAMTGEDRRRG